MTANYIPESHVRLYATATEGLPAEHSHYYRRLISAGYKGYIQGNVAGATLYGVLGAAVGTAVSIALLPFGIGGVAFAAVPVLAGFGLLKGADTFGKIGSQAAQLAEFAETNERRRALLDRLDETPSQAEAQEIKRLLQEDTIDQKPQHLFHGKTALVGALAGAVILTGLAAMGLYGFLPHGVEGLIGSIGGGEIAGAFGHAATNAGHAAAELAPALVAQVLGVAGIIGAAIGSMIGLDRGWIRRWFDLSENTIHDQQYYEGISRQRAQEIARLHEISRQEARIYEQTPRPAPPNKGNTITSGADYTKHASNTQPAEQVNADLQSLGSKEVKDTHIAPITATSLVAAPSATITAENSEEKGRLSQLQQQLGNTPAV